MGTLAMTLVQYSRQTSYDTNILVVSRLQTQATYTSPPARVKLMTDMSEALEVYPWGAGWAGRQAGK